MSYREYKLGIIDDAEWQNENREYRKYDEHPRSCFNCKYHCWNDIDEQYECMSICSEHQGEAMDCEDVCEEHVYD